MSYNNEIQSIKMKKERIKKYCYKKDYHVKINSKK